MKINITYEQAWAKASPILRRKMEYTVNLLRRSEKLALKYDPERGFFTGFSGGKDSQALFHMMQLAGVKFSAYFSPTSCDPPENIRFIKTHYPEVEFVKISESIYDVFRRLKVLPSMRIRWCCSIFKERGGEGKVVCTGVRKTESPKRSKRNEIELPRHKFSGHIEEFEEWSEKRIRRKIKNLNRDQFSEVKESEIRCIKGNDRILLNPIIEWTESDVWEFLNKVVEVPHCELYDQGWSRIGCILCPMASGKPIARDLKRWPHVKEKWIKAIMDVRRDSILESTPPRLDDNDLTDSELIHESKRVWRDDIDKAFEKFHITAPSDTNFIPDSKADGMFRYLNPSFDSDGSQYDEVRERAIAEKIFDWWISKKSFSQWFSETYRQGHLFDDSDLADGE